MFLSFLFSSSYVRFDIIQRILSRVFGINVIHVMVITDIDDKIIQRSLQVSTSHWQYEANTFHTFQLAYYGMTAICLLKMYCFFQENISPTVLTQMYEEEFKNDMLALKVSCIF